MVTLPLRTSQTVAEYNVSKGILKEPNQQDNPFENGKSGGNVGAYDLPWPRGTSKTRTYHPFSFRLVRWYLGRKP